MSLLKSLLDYSIKNEASDIHISEGEAVGFRVHGKIIKAESAGIIDKTKIQSILLDIYKGNQTAVKTFMEKRDDDFAYVNDDGTPFRVNAFYKLGKVAFVLRRIAATAKSMEDLKLPEGAQKFVKAKQGLILVTGPTGSGKSTSMISILDAINETRGEHILTIEDPVEFLFTPKKSVFSQREVGKDTKSFPAALRAAMREDPDVIMVGEMRDKETVEAALEMAETGHLVISTLHTAGSVQTITRLVNFFNPDIQHAIRYKLADVLFGVMSQRLIPRADGPGRAGIFELMFMTPGIKNLIRAGDLAQVNNNIEMGSSEGMIRMQSYANRLAAEGIVKEEDYINYFEED